jgi:hypothetical protein
MRLHAIGPREERGAVGVGADGEPVEALGFALEDEHSIHEVNRGHQSPTFERLEEDRLADVRLRAAAHVAASLLMLVRVAFMPLESGRIWVKEATSVLKQQVLSGNTAAQTAPMDARGTSSRPIDFSLAILGGA